MCSIWLKLIQFSIIYFFTLQNVTSFDYGPPRNLIWHQKSQLPGPLEPKMAITIIGRPWYIRGRFNFDLQDPAGNIGFHLSVRHKEDKLIFNAMINGKWGDEEVYPDSFSSYEDFNVTRIAARDAYHFQIYFHKKEYIFRSRMPTENLKLLVIEGTYQAFLATWEREIEDGKFEKIQDIPLIRVA